MTTKQKLAAYMRKYRAKNREAQRSYMREYMAKRRATAKAAKETQP